MPTAPVVPPPSGQAPPSARYPLFADAPPTVTTADADATRITPAAPAPQPPPFLAPAPVVVPGAPAPPSSPERSPGRRPAWLPWLVALVLLAVIGGVGGVLLLGNGDDDTASDERSARPSDSTGPTDGATDGSTDPEPEPAQPDSSGTGGPVEAPDPDDVVDLTAGLTAEVPAIAPPSRDRQNRPVRFRPANMWDARPRTAWRMPGDGTGRTLTFELADDVVITEVGLINGYAKVDGPTNWYTANRRIRTVQWEFDDGTRVTQELDERQVLQMVDLGPVETRTVTLHLLEVSEPAAGVDGRDFTAISEVSLLGVLR